MIKDLKKFFEEKLMPGISAEDNNHSGIEYATAALLIELAKSDFEEDDIERQLIIAMVRDTFDMNSEEVDDLLTLAENATAEANDLYQFTSLINEHYDNDAKIELLENLWKVAYADGRLDKYEEQFIRKVAGLINLPPSEFTKTKLRIKARLE